MTFIVPGSRFASPSSRFRAIQCAWEFSLRKLNSVPLQGLGVAGGRQCPSIPPSIANRGLELVPLRGVPAHLFFVPGPHRDPESNKKKIRFSTPPPLPSAQDSNATPRMRSQIWQLAMPVSEPLAAAIARQITMPRCQPRCRPPPCCCSHQGT